MAYYGEGDKLVEEIWRKRVFSSYVHEKWRWKVSLDLSNRYIDLAREHDSVWKIQRNVILVGRMRKRFLRTKINRRKKLKKYLVE